MRSTEPMPGNPWPHDMMLSVEDRPHALLEMLWIRQAYDLQPEGEDLPPLLAVPPMRHVDPPSDLAREQWTSAWPSLWTAALRHAGKEYDPASHDRLRRTGNGSRERREQLQEIVGPTWRDELGPDALDTSSYREWDEVIRQRRTASRPASVEADTLRRNLDAVVPAWKAGMTTIITIPCEGEYTRRVGNNAMLITENTITADDMFRRALRVFR